MEQEAVNRAKEAPDFMIDDEAGALLNTNNKGLHLYRMQRQQAKKMRTDSARIDKLESDMAEIKALLQTVIKVMNK